MYRICPPVCNYIVIASVKYFDFIPCSYHLSEVQQFKLTTRRRESLVYIPPEFEGKAEI